MLANEIRTLDEKAKELKANTYPWARRPIWLATVFMVLFVGCIVIGMVSGPAGRAFSRGNPALDTGSDGFKAFESQVKAYWGTQFDLSKIQPDRQKAFWQLLASEVERERKVKYSNFDRLTEPEQTKINQEMTTELVKFLLTSEDLPDYMSATLAKQINLPVSAIASPPERSGPEFHAFVASCKLFGRPMRTPPHSPHKITRNLVSCTRPRYIVS